MLKRFRSDRCSIQEQYVERDVIWYVSSIVRDFHINQRSGLNPIFVIFKISQREIFAFTSEIVCYISRDVGGIMLGVAVNRNVNL